MSVWETVGRGCILLGAVAILTLMGGQAAGQPVLLSYVETESMSPTMEPGDGFVPVPTQIAGPVENGDVVTFEAQELHGGGLTTHRIVEKTDRGYITQGDGNPFRDQDNEEPPVKRPQIVAKALELNGKVIVIPQFGTVVEGIQSVLKTGQQKVELFLGTGSTVSTQTLAGSIFIATLLWYLVGERRENATARGERDRSRETGSNTRLILGGCAALLVLSATAAMVGPAGSHEYGIVSASFDSDRPTVIPQGESQAIPYPVDNSGLLPIVSYVKPASKGVAVEPQELTVQPRSLDNATITLQAPSETGYYRRYVREHRYLAVLPKPVIDTLYVIHPWTPILAIDLLIGGLFYTFGRKIIGVGRIRNRSRSVDAGSGRPFNR